MNAQRRTIMKGWSVVSHALQRMQGSKIACDEQEGQSWFVIQMSGSRGQATFLRVVDHLTNLSGSAAALATRNRHDHGTRLTACSRMPSTRHVGEAIGA